MGQHGCCVENQNDNCSPSKAQSVVSVGAVVKSNNNNNSKKK